jgi:hypothetical protein
LNELDHSTTNVALVVEPAVLLQVDRQ